MPAYLKHDSESGVLSVALGGMDGPEFSEALARVKAIPGRRYNPDNKRWEFPDDADTAIRIMHILEPTADAATRALVAARAEQIADDLLTALPDDAAVSVPWGPKLRPYQRAGVDRLVTAPRTILGDEMGLGKTITALSAPLERALRAGGLEAYEDIQAGRTDTQQIAIVPRSLFGTWAEEVVEWTRPREEPTIIDGKSEAKRRKQLDKAEGFVILNWEQFRGKNADALIKRLLARATTIAVYADEAHRMKNKDAQQTSGVTRLVKQITKRTGDGPLPLIIPMTGTPIMSNPADLWTLLRIIRPEQYTSYWAFYHSYVDSYRTSHGREMTGLKNVDALRFEISDKLIRRTKTHVLKDLPPKLPPQRIPVPLTPQQRKLYDAAEKEFFLDVATWAMAHPEITPEELASMSVEDLSYMIPNGAARTTKLRQIASSPALLGGPDDSAKFDAAVEIIRDNYPKPFVVFTWFVDSANLLAERLRRGKPALRVGVIAGSADPTETVHEFQAGELDVVVATIAKGGVGLTLTHADTAIFVERDWTPAINAQAEDRLHRIGQKNPVSIIILEAVDTVDTGAVADANRFKQMIADQVLGEAHGADLP